MEFFGNYFKTFLYICLDHMQSFIKIGGQVSEKSCLKIQRDIHLLLSGFENIYVKLWIAIIKNGSVLPPGPITYAHVA